MHLHAHCWSGLGLTLTTNVFQFNLSIGQLLFRAILKIRLLLLKWIALTQPKSMHISKNCQWEGLIHKWKHTLLALLNPLMSVNISWFCSTHNHCSALLYVQKCNTNDKLCIPIKAQPCTQSTWSDHQLGLVHSRNMWAYPTISLGHCVPFQLRRDTNMLLQTGIIHYSQLAT